MTLSIQTFVGGPVETNAYLIADTTTGEALVVDAPDEICDEIVTAAAKRGWRIKQLIITHTHWDHVADAAELRAATNAQLAAHPLAVQPLAHPVSLFGGDLPVDVPPVATDRLLHEGDMVVLGSHSFRVLHLPGHDPSHIALFSEADRLFFGGDVVFPAGHGRTDLPGSDQATMDRSLARLVDLPPDTVVYPGHGATTTLGSEAGWIKERAGADQT